MQSNGPVFGHVTCFLPSNLSKSKNKNVYIIIANGYTTEQHLEVSQSSYLTRGRKKRLHVHKCEAGERGWGPNPTKPSAMARFQARCVKWQWKARGGGGGMK